MLFKSEDSVVAEVLEEIVEQVSSLVDLEGKYIYIHFFLLFFQIAK